MANILKKSNFVNFVSFVTFLSPTKFFSPNCTSFNSPKQENPKKPLKKSHQLSLNESFPIKKFSSQPFLIKKKILSFIQFSSLLYFFFLPYQHPFLLFFSLNFPIFFFNFLPLIFPNRESSFLSFSLQKKGKKRGEKFSIFIFIITCTVMCVVVDVK